VLSIVNETSARPSGASKGDLYVKVMLEVPTKLNTKQKKAIEDMGKELPAESYHKKSKFAETIKELFK
jgi:molecular chaperone DnaJ